MYIEKEFIIKLPTGVVGLFRNLTSLSRGLEDNDDGDDRATGNSAWVLSIRDKSKLQSFTFKPVPTTSTQLRAQEQDQKESGRRCN